LEIEIVRLISNGTSAMVTACSTYLSGGSVVLNVPRGVAVVTDALPVQCLDVAARQPLAAHIARLGRMDVCAEAVRAGIVFLIGRRIQPVALNDMSGLIENPLALDTNQHFSSSSGISMYYPQSQPRPSRKSLQGHLLSGFFSNLQGQ
jgi:hypothetical protein